MYYFADNILVAWPKGVEDVPFEASSIIEELLRVEPLVRLGSAGMKEHDFFSGLEWDTLLGQKAEFVSSLDLESTNIYVNGNCKLFA